MGDLVVPKEMIWPKSLVDFNDPFFREPIWDFEGTQGNCYLIALAAIQRGLEVTFWGSATLAKSTAWSFLKAAKPRLYSVSDGRKSHFFDQTMGDLSKYDHAMAAKDKQKTKEILTAHGCLTPAGIAFNGGNHREILSFLQTSDAKQFITKPIAGSGAKHMGHNMERNRIMELIRRLKNGSFLLEEQVTGREFRVYVVNDRVAGAFERIATTVIGNGRDSIAALVMARNKHRAGRPHYVNRQIDLPSTAVSLSKSGISMNRVPVFGKKVVLSETVNIKNGATYRDVTNELPLDVAQAAIAANRAMLLPNSGVDVIDQEGKPFVLEINARASIQHHAFQEYGPFLQNTVAEAIVDAYFPSKDPIVRNNDLGVDAQAMTAAFEKNGLETVHRIEPVLRPN